MDNNTKITVVTVCYNAVEMIERTIISVLNQTYNNIEYIIVDGASNDGTVEIIKKYSDKLAFFISEPDKGIYDAMNKAIDHATGEWINFMNSGDCFASNKVISDIFGSYRGDAGVIFGNTLLNQGNKIRSNKGRINENDFPDLVHQSTFVRTKLMKSFHFDTAFVISADFAFLYKLYQSNIEFYYVDKDVSVYDMSGLSSTNREILYREHCKIRDTHPRMINLLKYKIDDALPIKIVWFVRELLHFKS